MVFPVVMYGYESWTVKKAEYQRVDVFELWCWRRLLRVPWMARRSNQSILKEIVLNIHWKDWCESEIPILWPPDAKNWLIGKNPDAAKDWRQEEKGTAEDEMVSWHHCLNRHEYKQAPGVFDGQGSLACCMHSWGGKELDMTEWLSWNFLPQKVLGFYFNRSKNHLFLLLCDGLPQNHILLWTC